MPNGKITETEHQSLITPMMETLYCTWTKSIIIVQKDDPVRPGAEAKASQ